MVDGAIYGFAVGAGFALVENIYFLYEINSNNVALWIVRGFGTAIMHGGTTSILAIIIMRAIDKQHTLLLPSLIGLISAIIIHSLYNHFILPPVVTMLFILSIVTVIEIIIFRSSEKSLRKWLELEFDSEVKLLSMIRKGKFIDTRSGEYLMTIKNRFSGLVVVDLFAYISLYLELSIRAKSKLMLHEAGLDVPRDEEISLKLDELKSLEKNIGITGLLAISPILRISRKNLWKWSMLK